MPRKRDKRDRAAAQDHQQAGPFLMSDDQDGGTCAVRRGQCDQAPSCSQERQQNKPTEERTANRAQHVERIESSYAPGDRRDGVTDAWRRRDANGDRKAEAHQDRRRENGGNAGLQLARRSPAAAVAPPEEDCRHEHGESRRDLNDEESRHPIAWAPKPSRCDRAADGTERSTPVFVAPSAVWVISSSNAWASGTSIRIPRPFDELASM